MTRTTLRRALASLAVLLVALTGCSGDPEPRMADPSPTATSPSSVDAPNGPPAIPQAAEDNTRSGVVAFARHFWAVASYSQRSGDTAPVRELSADTCTGCLGAADRIDGVYENGGTLVGGDFRVLRLAPDSIFVRDDRDFDVSFTVRSTAQIVKVPGEEVVRHRPATFDGHMTVNWINGTFRVDILELA